MRWLVSFVIFGMIVAGFFNATLANEETHNAGEKGAKVSHHENHDVGVHQPVSHSEKAELPGKVKLSSPQALAKVPAGSVSLKWEAAPNAEVYHVQVAKDPRYKWIVTENHDVKGQSFEVSGLESGKQYFWRVAGRRPDNDAGWTKGAFTGSSFEVQ